MRAPETDCPAPSTARRLTTARRLRVWRRSAMLSRAGVTFTLASADRVADRGSTIALTVARPSERAAVNVVEFPTLGDSVPTRPGVTDHEARTGKRFPRLSVATAVSSCVARARTAVDRGVTASETGAPGSTVMICVPLVRPAADAVSV